MINTEYKIIDNIIYTPDVEDIVDTKGVGHYFYSQLKTYKDKIAQIDADTHEKDTFDSLLQRCIRTSLVMIDLDLKPGDHISLLTHNHLNTAVPYIASYFVGTIMGAIDPSMSVQEATHLLKQTRPKLIFVSETAVSLAEEVVERIGSDTKIVVFGETTRHIPFSLFLRPHQNENSFFPRQIDSLNEVALIVFSSGTSGFPKGICFSHLNMLHFNKKQNIAVPMVLGSVSSPYWRVYSMFLISSVQYGCTRVIYPSFSMDNIWSIFQIPVDLAFLSTVQILCMIKSEKPKDLELENIPNLVTAGNSFSQNQIEELRAVLPYTSISITYGQSEVFKTILQFPIPPSELMLHNSVGTVVRGISYKIVDIDSGKILGPNQVGELQVKTPAQFIGYYNQDSSDCFDSDGWLKTGDLLYYDENLHFYVVDRIKETFKFDRYCLSPTEIEHVILNLDPVENVVVIPIPHETEFNHPMAIIKLKPNAREISAEEIVKFVEDHLEDKKRLRGGVKFVDSIPFTPTGKLHRFKLKQMVLNNEI